MRREASARLLSANASPMPGPPIGSYWGNPKTRTFAELLIDCEEDSGPPGCARGDAAGSELSPFGRWAQRKPSPHGEPAVI